MSKSKTYKIKHEYDVGDQSVLVDSPVDPTDFAIFIQFKLEELIGESISPPNEVVASALCEFFECKPSANDSYDKMIDMYFDRELRCGDWYSKVYPSISVDESELKSFVTSEMQKHGLMQNSL